MVEVFITNIQNKIQAESVLKNIQKNCPGFEIHYELGETEFPFPCGHSILWVEGKNIASKRVMELVLNQGFKCEVLEDKICT